MAFRWNPFKKNNDDADLVSQKRRRDHRRLDYRYAEDDPFFFIKGNGVWTGVVAATTTDDFDTVEEELSQVSSIAQMYKAISTYFSSQHNQDEVQVHRITRYRPSDAQQWSDQLIDSCWDPSEMFTTLVRGPLAKHLEESTPERREYLLIRLGEFTGETEPDWVTRLTGTSESVADEYFQTRDLMQWRRRALAVTEVLGRYGASPMTRADLSWLIRRTLSGHLPVDDTTSYIATRPWRGSSFDLIADYSGHPIGDYVRSEGIDPDTQQRCSTYTTTLSVTSHSTIMRYQFGDSWAKRLRDMPRPVDISWRSTLISPDAWRKLVRRKISDVNTEAEERDQNSSRDSASFDELYEVSREVERSLDRPDPVIVGQLRLTISAPSPEELDDVVSKVRSELISMDENTVIERRKKIQGLLLEEQLPGDLTVNSRGGMGICRYTGGVDTATRYTGLEALSFARLDSSPVVGDNLKYLNGRWLGWFGVPIGYARENGAVAHFDPMCQVARNSGAGVLIIGATGSGKTSLALLLFFYVSESGTQTIVFDPKNDFESFAYFLAFGSQVNDDGFDAEARAGTLGTSQSRFQPVNRTFWDETDIASLGGGRAGLLDPWDITDDYMEGENLARNVLRLLITDKSAMKYLDSAFRRMRERYQDGQAAERPTLSALSSFLNEELEKNATWMAESNRAEDRIKVDEQIKMLESLQDELFRAQSRPGGQLLFADPKAEVKPFRIGKQRRTIITLFGLTLPDSDDADVSQLDDDKRDAIAASYIVLKKVASYALGSARTSERRSPNHGRRQRPPLCVFLDELKTFTIFDAGRQMLSELLRKGRSLNVTVVPISQQAKDTQGIEKSQGDDGEEVNQFGTVFVFHQKGSSEAKKALKLLRATEGMDDVTITDMASRLLEGNLTQGQGAMRDAEGRVSIIQVDRIFDELVAASETNASIKSSVQDFDPAADGKWVARTEVRDRFRQGINSRVSAYRRTAQEEMEEYEAGLREEIGHLEHLV